MIDGNGKRFCNELGRRDYVSEEMVKGKGPFRYSYLASPFTMTEVVSSFFTAASSSTAAPPRRSSGIASTTSAAAS